MRVGGLRQLIELDLGRADGTGLMQFGDALEGVAGHGHLRPERRTSAGRLRRLFARRDERSAAARLEHRERLLRHVAPDGVEHRIATGHRLVKSCRCSRRSGQPPGFSLIAVRAARGRDHAGPICLAT